MFITPGTPRIVIISYSMNYGVKKCVWTALGDVTANIIQATLVIFVIGSFISDNPKLLNTFKWFGIVYILYLAYDIYKSRPKSINSDEKSDDINEGQNQLLKIVKDISSKGFLRSNYKKKLVDLSDIRINLKGKK